MASDDFKEILKNDVSHYHPNNELELLFKARFIDLIKKYPDCANRSLKHAHLTGSAWIVNDEASYALMTHHLKLNRWLQLGGHADGDFNIKNVALREVKEESGLASIKIVDSKIFDIDIHKIPERKNEPAHEHFDIRYLMHADQSEPISKNHESKEISWIPLNKLDELTSNNRSILRMAKKISVD